MELTVYYYQEESHQLLAHTISVDHQLWHRFPDSINPLLPVSLMATYFTPLFFRFSLQLPRNTFSSRSVLHGARFTLPAYCVRNLIRLCDCPTHLIIMEVIQMTPRFDQSWHGKPHVHSLIKKKCTKKKQWNTRVCQLNDCSVQNLTRRQWGLRSLEPRLRAAGIRVRSHLTSISLEPV